MPSKKEVIDSYEKTCNNDSKQPTLNLDSIVSILERLSFLDFHRARCVSSEWYSASKSCKTTPSLILFQNNGSCEVFDPRHDDNTYKVRDLGYLFATSLRCLASSGNWFLMLSSTTNFLLLNLFTRETIPLPSLISYTKIGKAVLWVDEKTRDYLVVWNFDTFHLAYHKKGHNNKSWKSLQPIKNNRDFLDMVLKETKLYVFTEPRNIFLVDFSGDYDKRCEVNLIPPPVFYHREQYFLNLAVTLSGEVLIIASHVGKTCFFDVYKMDPKFSTWSKIKSIGDEVLLLDLGITVKAKDGAMRNCIYFSDDPSHRHTGVSLSNDDNRICVYHIQTDLVLQRFQRLPVPFKDARWFLPSLL